MSGVTVGLLLLGAFAITGPAALRSRWFERGALVADRVGNEPWRAVTALTLHVDLVHVVGNAAAVAVLLGPLAQRLGVGVALALTLLAGAGGNVLSSLVHAPGHAAVGASTATFGIIGALAALQLMAAPAPNMKPRRRFIVAGATLLLLTILGTAREADVVAHALGLACGGVLGAGAGVLVRRRPSALVQGALALSAAMAIAGAWRLAFTPRW
jgi:membrane associated rhomboid family serine protease